MKRLYTHGVKIALFVVEVIKIINSMYENKIKTVKTEIYFAQISNTLKIRMKIWNNNYVHHVKLSSGIKKLIQITIWLRNILSRYLP